MDVMGSNCLCGSTAGSILDKTVESANCCGFGLFCFFLRFLDMYLPLCEMAAQPLPESSSSCFSIAKPRVAVLSNTWIQQPYFCSSRGNHRNGYPVVVAPVTGPTL